MPRIEIVTGGYGVIAPPDAAAPVRVFVPKVVQLILQGMAVVPALLAPLNVRIQP